MKKLYVTIQFVSELLIVTVVSLLIGAGIGALSSVPVSNQLLASEISSSNEQVNNINDNFGGGDRKEDFKGMDGVVNVQAYDSIDAVVDFKVLLELFGIGLLLTLVGSLASMISIQKFSPLTILKERS
jgi:putative ABC transport system permease protein